MIINNNELTYFVEDNYDWCKRLYIKNIFFNAYVWACVQILYFIPTYLILHMTFWHFLHSFRRNLKYWWWQLVWFYVETRQKINVAWSPIMTHKRLKTRSPWAFDFLLGNHDSSRRSKGCPYMLLVSIIPKYHSILFSFMPKHFCHLQNHIDGKCIYTSRFNSPNFVLIPHDRNSKGTWHSYIWELEPIFFR